MIIDMHCHLGATDERTLSAEQLFRSMEANGVSTAVCFPFNASPAGLVAESRKIRSLSKEDGRVLPFLRVHPLRIAEQEFDGLLQEGFRGVKLHPASQDFAMDDERLDWLYAACARKGVPVLFHSYHTDERSSPRRLLRVAERFPRLNVVSGHFFGDLVPVIKEAREYPNVYADTSILPSVARIQDAVRKHDFPRLLFGSDVPYDTQRVALTKIYDAGLGKEDEERILFRNARRLLRL